MAENFREIHKGFLSQEDTQLTADSWVKGRVGKLLEIVRSPDLFKALNFLNKICLNFEFFCSKFVIHIRPEV